MDHSNHCYSKNMTRFYLGKFIETMNIKEELKDIAKRGKENFAEIRSSLERRKEGMPFEVHASRKIIFSCLLIHTPR